MTIETIAVTGGNGTIGSAMIEHLNDHGYRTVNLARGKRREEHSDEYRTTDLLDAGEVYGSLAASNPDALIHMGTIPGPTAHPDHVTYESNVMSTYHVLDAAGGLGLESVCLASSINVIGAAYQEKPAEIRYLPVNEEHPVTPSDPYGLAKHAIEVTADGVGRRSGSPERISSVRYPLVGDDETLQELLVDTDRTLSGLRDAWHHTTRDVLFSYLHLEDATNVARRCIEADYEGHERFWAVASDTTAAVPTDRLVTEFYPEATHRRSFKDHEALIDCTKAEELLGWTPRRTWRSD